MKKINHTYAHPTTIDEMLTVAHHLARAGFGKGDQSVCFALIQYGAEMGLGPMQAIMGVHIMQGKFTLDATLVASIIQRSGRYRYHISTLTSEVASIDFFDGDTLLGNSTFTMSDAKTAGLNSQTWKKFPQQMLRARALTNGARNYVPEVFGGPVYVPDELEVVDASEPAQRPDKPKAPPTPAMRAMAEKIATIAEQKCPGHGAAVVTSILGKLDVGELLDLDKDRLISVGRRLKGMASADLYQMIGVESPAPTEANIDAILEAYTYLNLDETAFRARLESVPDVRVALEALDELIEAGAPEQFLRTLAS